MDTSKMTSREFYNDVIELTSALIEKTHDEDNQAYLQSLRQYAFDAVHKMDEKNANKKPSKSSLEAGERKFAALKFLNENPEQLFNRDEIATAIDCSPAQATAAMTALVKEGLVVKSTTKVDKSSKTIYQLAKEDN